MFEVRGAKIAQQLRDVFIGLRPTSLELNDQPAVDKKIREELTKQCLVFAKDLERLLLGNRNGLLAQTVGQTVFIHHLCMAVTEVFVQSEAGLANTITKKEDVVFHASSVLCFLRQFAAK